jgi:small subunit ribosomal protein S8
MSMQDPISDMLTRIRNAQMRNKFEVAMPGSKIKEAIAKVLLQEGYVSNYSVSGEGKDKSLVVELKYFEGKGVIDTIKRVSRPSLRVYKGVAELPKVRSGLGEAIVSTAQGVMTASQARRINLGGEILCYVC